MTFFNIFKALVTSKDIKVTDNDRKNMIIYLIDSMDKPTPLYKLKEYLDAVIVYELSLSVVK